MPRFRRAAVAVRSQAEYRLLMSILLIVTISVCLLAAQEILTAMSSVSATIEHAANASSLP